VFYASPPIYAKEALFNPVVMSVILSVILCVITFVSPERLKLFHGVAHIVGVAKRGDDWDV